MDQSTLDYLNSFASHWANSLETNRHLPRWDFQHVRTAGAKMEALGWTVTAKQEWPAHRRADAVKTMMQFYPVQKINAIKEYRQITGQGLKESKALWARLDTMFGGPTQTY